MNQKSSFVQILETVPRVLTSDTRTTLIQLARSSGFGGRVAVSAHQSTDAERLIAAGADVVLEPFQDAADRAVELLCGEPTQERTQIPTIETEGKDLA